MGLAICEDIGVVQPPVDFDVYVAGLVHPPEELPEQEARAVVLARACRPYGVLASCAGLTGDVFAETVGLGHLVLGRYRDRPGQTRPRDSARANLY